jgi:hypothetical protein
MHGVPLFRCSDRSSVCQSKRMSDKKVAVAMYSRSNCSLRGLSTSWWQSSKSSGHTSRNRCSSPANATAQHR